MKSIIIKITLFSYFLFSLTSCLKIKEEISDSNSPIVLNVTIYEKGKDTSSNNEVFDYKELKVKIIPKKTPNTVIERSYAEIQGIRFPLYLYSLDKKEAKLKESKLEAEEFQLIVFYKDKEILNEQMETHYVQIGHPFPSISKVYYWNGEKKEEYKFPRYKIIDEKGDNNIEFECQLSF